MSIDFVTEEEKEKRLKTYLYQTDEQRQGDLKRWKRHNAAVKAEKIAAKEAKEKAEKRAREARKQALSLI